jgi:hypothetical protein
MSFYLFSNDFYLFSRILLYAIINAIFTNWKSKAKLGCMLGRNQMKLPWDTIVGMGSYLVGDQFCNLDSQAIKITTEVVCSGCSDIASALKAIYMFVKDNIAFGTQFDSTLTASQILGQGYGDGVGKTILFAAMSRTAKIPTRFHGYMALSSFLHGLEPLSVITKLPKKILAITPEVFIGDRWISLGGVTLDCLYVERLESIMHTLQYYCYGYGLASDLDYPIFLKSQRIWDGVSDTACQTKAFAEDLGLHTKASSLIEQHSLKGANAFMWSKFTAPAITKSIQRIRGR